MSKHLVLIGGGHAHMMVMRHLAEFTRGGCKVTLVSPEPYHYYSGMGPGLLGGTYRPAQARFHVQQMVSARGGVFCRDQVLRINWQQRRLQLASGRIIDYDLASCNVGSEVAIRAGFTPGGRLIPVKPVVNLSQIRQRLLALPDAALSLAVVGGGAAGCEVAGNLQRLLSSLGRKGTVELFAGSQLLKHFPVGVQKRVQQRLSQNGIVVRAGEMVAFATADGLIGTEGGSERQFDLVLLATGVAPSPIFQVSGLPVTADGGLMVNRFLQSPQAPELFGGGDCISFVEEPLPKVGVHAVRQNPILLHNLKAALEGRPLRAYRPQKECLLILNTGDGLGVASWRSMAVSGRFPFYLKDRLDQGFMRRFQVSGELQE